MQFDPYTKEVKRLVKEKPFGNVQFVSGEAGYISKGKPDQWRLNHALSGGGALMVMGVFPFRAVSMVMATIRPRSPPKSSVHAQTTSRILMKVLRPSSNFPTE